MGFPGNSTRCPDPRSASQRMHRSPFLSQHTTTNCPGSRRWPCTLIQSPRVQSTNHAEEPRAGPMPLSVQYRRAQSHPLTGLIIPLPPPRRRVAMVRRFGKSRANRGCGGDAKVEIKEKERQRTCEEGEVWMRGEGGMIYGVRCWNPMLNERG